MADPEKDKQTINDLLNEVSEKDFMLVQERAKATPVCEICGNESWVNMTNKKGDMLSSSAPADYTEDRGDGFSILSTICLNCGNVRFFSKAVVNYYVRHPVIKE